MTTEQIAMVCAGIGVVSAVLYHVVNVMKLRALRDIRDRIPRR